VPIVHEGGVLLFHRGLPFRCSGAGEGSLVQIRLDTISGREGSNGVMYRTRWEVMWSNSQAWHGGLFENILFGLTIFKVTTRSDKDRRVIEQVCHEFPVANGVRQEAGRAVSLM
jgi:hypothetical protein